MIAQSLKTRTVDQVRSHLQKQLLKTEKSKQQRKSKQTQTDGELINGLEAMPFCLKFLSLLLD